MTPEQTREAIRVMQHFADGKRIEFRWRDGDGTWWCPMKAPMWDWDSAEYRIAREPLRTWVVVDLGGAPLGYNFLNPLTAQDFVARHGQKLGPYRVVEMVEVTK